MAAPNRTDPNITSFSYLKTPSWSGGKTLDGFYRTASGWETIHRGYVKTAIGWQLFIGRFTLPSTNAPNFSEGLDFSVLSAAPAYGGDTLINFTVEVATP